MIRAAYSLPFFIDNLHMINLSLLIPEVNQGWALLQAARYDEAYTAFVKLNQKVSQPPLTHQRHDDVYLRIVEGLATAEIHTERLDDAYWRLLEVYEVSKSPDFLVLMSYVLFKKKFLFSALFLISVAQTSEYKKDQWESFKKSYRARIFERISPNTKDIQYLLSEISAIIEQVNTSHKKELLAIHGGDHPEKNFLRIFNAYFMKHANLCKCVDAGYVYVIGYFIEKLGVQLNVLAIAKKLFDKKNVKFAHIFYQLAIIENPLRQSAVQGHCACLMSLRRLDEPYMLLSVLVKLVPHFREAWNNLSGTLSLLRINPIKAEVAAKKAIELDPKNESLKVNLAYAMRDQGRVDEAIALLELARQTCHDGIDIIDASLCFSYLYSNKVNIQKVKQFHINFANDLKKISIKNRPKHVKTFNKTSRGELRKVGLVSADFCLHPVMNHIEYWLQHHNKDLFSLVLFNINPKEDVVTNRIKKYDLEYHNVAHMNDEALYEYVIEQNLDIVFDMSGYTSGNRVMLFMWGCAPLQINFLGYPFTMGSDIYDFRIMASYHENFINQHTEPIYFINPVSTYRPLLRYSEKELAEADLVNMYSAKPTPALANGFITFGCCNNFAKINPEVIKVWSDILLKVEGSKLLMEAPGIEVLEFSNYVKRCFMLHGVSDDRLILINRDSKNQYLTYHNIDIALDPFPYGGATTTFDLLWMGTPLVTLKGKTEIGSLSAYYLSSVGRSDWVAHDHAGYVQIAVKLATNPDKLNVIRKSLENDFRKSDFLDGRAYAKKMDQAMFNMWNN